MKKQGKKYLFTMPDIDQPDPEPGFQHSSDEFIVPATDDEGEKVRVWLYVPANLHACAAELVRSGKFPFRYDADLFRYGIYLAVRQLNRIERAVPSLQANLEASRLLVNRRMMSASVMDHVDQFVIEMEKLYRRRAWGELTYLLAQEKRNARASVEFEPYWGQQWLEAIEERCAEMEVKAIEKLDLLLKEQPHRYFPNGSDPVAGS